MKKIKIFYNSDVVALQKDIDKWLEKEQPKIDTISTSVSSNYGKMITILYWV